MPGRTGRPDDVVYRLGPGDEVTWVGGGWDSFAVQGGVPALAGDGILGRVLWEFVSDPATRAVYRAVLDRARAGQVVEFPLRCDSDRVCRWLIVCVTPFPPGQVEFRTRVVREEARPAVALIDPAVPRSGYMVRMCGWCKRVEVDGAWAEVEDAVAALGLFERPAVPPVTHGMCRECAGRMMALLDRGDVA